MDDTTMGGEMGQSPGEVHDLPAEPDRTVDLAAWLEALVPPDGNEIEDVNGNVYTLPKSLSAARQVRVARRLRDILKGTTLAGERVQEIQQRFQAADGEGGAFEILLALEPVLDDAMVRELGALFTLALPDTVDAANNALQARMVDREVEPQPAEDLFALEEMIGALVPFFARAGSRIAKMLS